MVVENGYLKKKKKYRASQISLFEGHSFGAAPYCISMIQTIYLVHIISNIISTNNHYNSNHLTTQLMVCHFNVVFKHHVHLFYWSQLDVLLIFNLSNLYTQFVIIMLYLTTMFINFVGHN